MANLFGKHYPNLISLIFYNLDSFKNLLKASNSNSKKETKKLKKRFDSDFDESDIFSIYFWDFKSSSGSQWNGRNANKQNVPSLKTFKASAVVSSGDRTINITAKCSLRGFVSKFSYVHNVQKLTFFKK